MEYERKGVTINWQIDNAENISLQRMELFSPLFSVDSMEKTKWKLVIHKIFTSSSVWLAIKREAEDDGPEEFGLDYQFSVYSLQESSLLKSETHSCVFKKDHMCSNAVAFSYKLDVCLCQDLNFPLDPSLTYKNTFSELSKNLCATGEHVVKPKNNTLQKNSETGQSKNQDTLIIRCKMWRQQGSIPKSVYIFAKTQMKIETSTFVGRVENFSSLSVTDKKSLETISSSTGEGLMQANLVLSKTYELPQIELIPIKKPSGRYYKFQIHILDSFDNKTDVGKLERKFTYISPMIFTLTNVSKEMLLKSPSLYLPNDTLSLHCELTFCSGKEYENIEKIEFETESDTEANYDDLSNTVEFLIKSEESPCDFKLQTATEEILGHVSILSSQSPVFEAMFKSNMRETVEKCVNMDDMEAETVKRVLVFLYSGTLEVRDWKDVMKLYVAADKYQILSLKQKCADFLVESLDLSNCCVLLHLADMHQDKSLKGDVQDYIVENKSRVIHCDQWRKVQQNLPQLANKILSCEHSFRRFKILRKRGRGADRHSGLVLVHRYNWKEQSEQ